MNIKFRIAVNDVSQNEKDPDQIFIRVLSSYGANAPYSSSFFKNDAASLRWMININNF